MRSDIVGIIVAMLVFIVGKVWHPEINIIGLWIVAGVFGLIGMIAQYMFNVKNGWDK